MRSVNVPRAPLPVTIGGDGEAEVMLAGNLVKDLAEISNLKLLTKPCNQRWRWRWGGGSNRNYRRGIKIIRTNFLL